MEFKPYVVCEECFNKKGPCEEKSCTHGCREATCEECGKVRVKEDPYWHCIGTVKS